MKSMNLPHIDWNLSDPYLSVLCRDLRYVVSRLCRSLEYSVSVSRMFCKTYSGKETWRDVRTKHWVSEREVSEVWIL